MSVNKSPVEESPVKCPKCGSTYIDSSKKGFHMGKAALGGFLLGGVGLLGGALGRHKIRITCLKCGKQWIAGK
jgi:tellurium resistance protein TerD